jgi:hypothetical protein
MRTSQVVVEFKTLFTALSHRELSISGLATGETPSAKPV